MSISSDAVVTLCLAEDNYVLFTAETNYLWNNRSKELGIAQLKAFGNSAANILTLISKSVYTVSSSLAFPG